MPEQTDEQIALLVQRGDLEAFGLLIERYQQKISRYGRKFLANYQDIEDLVQEVFIKAYVNIRSFDTNRKFSSWLYRIAHNEYINALKKKKHEAVPFFDPDTLFPHPVAKEKTDRDVLDSDLKQSLDLSLDQLDPKYREPIILYFLEEMNYQEIAEVLHIPMSTVGVRLNRGKLKLREVYNKQQ